MTFSWKQELHYQLLSCLPYPDIPRTGWCRMVWWVSLPVNFTSDTLFAFDDGSAETGWNILPGNLVGLGIIFRFLLLFQDTWYLYVWFLNNSGGSGQMLTIDVFDTNHVIKDPHRVLATPGAWLSVPAPDIPFSGHFTSWWNGIIFRM